MEQHVPELIRTQNWQALRAALADANSSDIADLIIALPPDQEAFVFRLLPKDRAADVFSYLPPDHQEGLIESLSNEQVRSVMESLPPDDRTRLLEEMPAEVTRRLLATLSPDELKHARALLGYPEETAGRYMTPRYVTVQPSMTAAEALEHIRRTGRGKETAKLSVASSDDINDACTPPPSIFSVTTATPTTPRRRPSCARSAASLTSTGAPTSSRGSIASR